MLLLQNRNINEVKFEMCFRKNVYNENGDIITYEHTKEKADFFEILIIITEEKILSMLFDLDGYIVGLELRESKRKNSVTVMKRNYNGIFYIFPRNCINLKNDIIDYYLDYYNNDVVINDEYAQKLMEEVYDIVQYLKGKTKNSIYVAILDSILAHPIAILFEEKFYKRQGYLTQLSVSPPNVRPDNNHNYSIIQVVSGCKILAQRKKACGFCASFGTAYHEYTLQELEWHMECLLKKILVQ